MAKRGSGKGRFTGKATRNEDEPQACIHDVAAGTLHIRFVPKKAAGYALIDCSAFLRLPLCAQAFAEALSKHAKGRMRGTVEATAKNLQYGFVRFATEEGLADRLRVSDIDTALINAFISFLSEKRPDGSFVLAASTRLHRLGSLKTILEWLRESGESLPQDCEVQTNPWPQASRNEKRQSPAGLTKEEWIKFYGYCCRVVAKTMAEVESIWREEQGDSVRSLHRVQGGPLIGGGQELLLQAKARFGCKLPERQALKASKDPMFEAIDAYGYARLARSFGPYAADLCAFVYYLLFTTSSNLQPLVDVRVDNVRLIENLGRKLITVGSLKHRATTPAHPGGKPVRFSFTIGEDPMSPASVLQFLLRWTRYLRENSESPIRNSLFLFIPRNRTDASRLSTYAQEGRRISNFQRHATAFCRDGGFDWVGARQVRDAAAAYADELFRGDVVATGNLLQHSNVETTRQHYQNASVRARQDANLAKGMQHRQRWVDSGGRIEPRNVDSDHDLSSATTPFRCIDPYDSPIVGQEKGKLCEAYGLCPSCPFASVNLDSPHAAARCLQLKNAMVEFRAKRGAAAFRIRLRESYLALVKRWLPAFTPEVWKRAAKLNLPAFSDLE
jgi:integrase